MSEQGPALYYVLFHSPGEKWANGVPFNQQPGVMDHVGYMAGFLESGKLFVGGPFLDDSGGMMVLSAESQEAAEEIAKADPSVQQGLLTVTVKPWLVAMQQ